MDMVGLEPTTSSVSSWRCFRLSYMSDAGGSPPCRQRAPTIQQAPLEQPVGHGGWNRGESNPWPSECHSDALPTELRPRSARQDLNPLRQGPQPCASIRFGLAHSVSGRNRTADSLVFSQELYLLSYRDKAPPTRIELAHSTLTT